MAFLPSFAHSLDILDALYILPSFLCSFLSVLPSFVPSSMSFLPLFLLDSLRSFLDVLDTLPSFIYPVLILASPHPSFPTQRKEQVKGRGRKEGG